MKKLFGTDGIRGIANQYPMSVETVLAVGRAMVHVLRQKKRPKVLIGKDTRQSGYMLETALAAGVCSMGGDVLFIGPMPTPGISFLTKAMRADVGVVISASHNPFQDNGIKIFCRHGFKLPDDLEEKIESLSLGEEINNIRPMGAEVGRAHRIDDAQGRYIEFLKSIFPTDRSLDGLKIVVDCAHGATYKIAPVVLEELGAEVIVLGNKPNGQNINEDAGALHPQRMAEKVKEVGAHLGMALDGDGDRVIFSDENGNVIDGDAVLAICAEDLHQRGLLKGNTLVATVMSNQGVDDYLSSYGLNVMRTSVGDRYVVEAMRENKFNFGGESSGHIIFLDHATTGDGMIAALNVLRILVEREKPLSEIFSGYEPYPQILKNVRVKERKDFENVPEVSGLIKNIQTSLGKKGRLLIRYSGTESLLRVMIEGKEHDRIDGMIRELTSCIEKNLS